MCESQLRGEKKLFAICSTPNTFSINRNLLWTNLTFCNFYISRENRPCKKYSYDKPILSYLSHKSFYSTLLHNRNKVFDITSFMKRRKKCSQKYFSTVSLSNHRMINSLTEQGQSFNETNGTTVYKIFFAYFQFWFVAAVVDY